MEENKVAQISKHTDSSRSTDSGVSGNAQAGAKEIRDAKYCDSLREKIDRQRASLDHSVLVRGAQQQKIELLEKKLVTSVTECSRLASRVERLTDHLSLITGAFHCGHPQWVPLAKCEHLVCSKSRELLAGAHAEEK